MELNEVIEKVVAMSEQYKKRHADLNDEQLFPRDWYFIEDEELCAKILEDVLDKNILIRDSELYIKVHMGMVRDKIDYNIRVSVDNLLNKYK